MRRRRSPWLPLVPFLLLGGCSKPAPTASDFASLPADLVSAFCDWQARCCTAPEVALAGHGRYATADECRAAGLEHAVRDQLGLVAASIDEGRVEVRRDVAEACIAAYHDRPCNGTGGPTTPTTAPDISVLIDCPGGFVGRAPVGRRCDTVVDCVGGAHCYFDPVTADGICVVDRRQGEPCARDSDCAPGLACRTSDFSCETATNAGTPDGGASDGGASDGGLSDAAVSDAGGPDGGGPDSGGSDAGASAGAPLCIGR